MQLKVKDDTSSHPELGQHLDEAIDKDALASNSAETARNIPPHDLSATTPEAAYPLDKIIFKGEWDYLSDVWDLFQAEKEITPKFFANFVCSRANKLILIKVSIYLTKHSTLKDAKYMLSICEPFSSYFDWF